MRIEPGAHVTANVRLVRPLGEGGMGAVWVAEHLGLGAEVAVKFLQGAYAEDPAARARFSREAAASAQVKSSHVVRVYDHGLTDTQVPFIVMELLEGTDLSKRMAAEHALPPAEVTIIVAQLAKALEQAHEKGVVHRDIKPENIFLTSEGGEIFVKLLDFGIAKTEVLSKKTTGGRASTLAGETLGTPFYMSPEQFKDSKRIDHRSDLYSVGVVVYEALTGRLPFEADTLAALAITVSEGSFTPPSEVNPALPKSLDAWFAKACARSPADRFASARELSEALRVALGVAPRLSTGSGSYPAVPSSGRHVVVSGVDASELEAASLRETAFATSGGPSTVTVRTERKRWPLAAAVGGVLLLAGGIVVWRLAARDAGGAAHVSGTTSGVVATPPSTPPAFTTTSAGPSSTAALALPASASAGAPPPSASHVLVPAHATTRATVQPSASARPKGTNERDIW